MSTNSRDKRGRFVGGNPGGPGRPRRPVEQEYLAAFNATVTLSAWREIVDRAVEDAKKGDHRAREWLTRYLIGGEPESLLKLAASERAGLTADAAIDMIAAQERRLALLASFQGELSNLLCAQSFNENAKIIESTDQSVDEQNDSLSHNG